MKRTCKIFTGKGQRYPDSYFNKSQLRKGMKVELEHTRLRKVAKNIAKDHLLESPKYYTYLAKMEKKFKKVIRR